MTIRIDGTNTAANPGITGTDTDTGLQFGTDEVNIVTGGTARATVDSSGNLGVGTTSPTFSSGGGVHNKGSNNAFTSFRASVNTNTGVDFAAASDGKGYVYNRDNADLIIGTNNAERLRVLAAGGLTFGGDTAAVNALDKYEEGTWTPSLSSGGTIGAINNATYTRIGRLVMAYTYLGSMSSIPNNGSQFQIEGLPYDVQGGNWYGGGQISYAGSKNVSVWRPLVADNGDYIYFHRVDGSTASGKNSDFTGTADLIVAIWYFTDA